jgi:SAM-dependent methyltransferase
MQSEASLPPKELRTLVGSPEIDDFNLVGSGLVEFFKDHCDLKPYEKMLEPGCGCGRVAQFLTKYLDNKGQYEGFDIVEKSIEWCLDNINSKFPNFHFTHSDIQNTFYNPAGKIKASEYRFPYADRSFDFVFLPSVFTHMLPEDMEHYFSEIARVLKTDGRCLISFYLLNEESIKNMNNNVSQTIFTIKGNYGVADINVPEAVVAYQEEYVKQLFKKNKLNIKSIYYGSWCGRTKYVRGQDYIKANFGFLTRLRSRL